MHNLSLAELSGLYRRGERADVVRACEGISPSSPWFAEACILAVRSHMDCGALRKAAEAAERAAAQSQDAVGSDALLLLAAHARLHCNGSSENRHLARLASLRLRTHDVPKWTAFAERWDARLIAFEVTLQERSLLDQTEVIAGLTRASQLYRVAGMRVESREELARIAETLATVFPTDHAEVRKRWQSLAEESREDADFPMEFRATLSAAAMDLADALQRNDEAHFAKASELYDRCRELSSQARLSAGMAEGDASYGRTLMRF
ncbi:MAG: hypothetical protein ACAI34_01740, partial [Verrucomicrobium sp.]